MQQLCIIGQIPYRAAVVLSNLVGGKNQENHEILLKFSEYQ